MELSFDTRASRLEVFLRQRRGVLAAAVFLVRSPEAEDRLVAYVVPNDEDVEGPSAHADESRIQKWRKTYELTQLSKESQAAHPGFNIVGWNSSYTRLPIPEDHMREWVDVSVQEVLRQNPSEVLELGCGTGLLLLRLAPRCKRYVGVDNARTVIVALQRQMRQLGGDWDHVEILERPADDFDGLAENSFDTLILSSVVQYFPSLDYLRNVLEKAVKVVKPGGRLFLGDLRSLPLQGPFATSVELFQAPAEMTVRELRERIAKRMRLDEQLVFSPELFLALRDRWPRISRVELQPRRGRFDNEMTRYRFNAILHVEGAPAERIDPEWAPWSHAKVTLESLAKILEMQKPGLLAIAEVPNRRIEKDVAAYERLKSANRSQTVDSLRRALEAAPSRGIDPQDLWTLGEKAGYDVQISWASSRADGSYDVVLLRNIPEGSSSAAAVRWPEHPGIRDDLAIYANAPAKAVAREKLFQQLDEYCKQNGPEMISSIDIVLLNSLPLDLNGKPDLVSLANVARL